MSIPQGGWMARKFKAPQKSRKSCRSVKAEKKNDKIKYTVKNKQQQICM